MRCGHAAKEKGGLAARCSSNKRKREGPCQCWLQLQEQQRSNGGGLSAQDENAPFAMALKSAWSKDEAAYKDATSPQKNCLLMNGPSKKKARKLTLAEKQEELCKETQQRVEAVSRNGRGLSRANKRKLQDKKKEEDSPIHKLNDSLLLNVFSKLPRRSDLNAVNQVCQRWRMVVTSPSLWRCQRCKGPIVRGLRRCFNYVAEDGRHEIDVFHDRTVLPSSFARK
ncbi:hypothetical protein QOT17_012216 [Balamuthia mandrillaris]